MAFPGIAGFAMATSFRSTWARFWPGTMVTRLGPWRWPDFGDAAALLRDTEQALLLAVEAAMSGNRLGAIGHAVESHARRLGAVWYATTADTESAGKCTKILTCRMWAARIAALSSDRTDAGHRADADPWQ